jgi:preprotein translocase subunit YajC
VFISEAFAQAAPAPTAAAESPFGSLGTMLPLVLMFVVLYFVMIRPQMKRQKEHKTMIEALAKGDEVVTSGGLAGRITPFKQHHNSGAARLHPFLHVNEGGLKTTQFSCISFVVEFSWCRSMSYSNGVRSTHKSPPPALR